MLAVDTNILVALLYEKKWPSTEVAADSLRNGRVYIPPIVLAEFMSYPQIESGHYHEVKNIALLDITEGYWERAGLLRAYLIRKKFKPKLPDVLIAQSCIDHNIPLLTNDNDFKIFEKHSDLWLYKWQ